MVGNRGNVGFLKTIFPNAKVYIRKEPSRDAASIGVGKSSDRVTILKTNHPVANQPIWYYVQHDKYGLKGWVPGNKLFVLNEPDPETLAKLRDPEIGTAINHVDNIESFQTFNRSQALLFSTKFIPKYYTHK